MAKPTIAELAQQNAERQPQEQLLEHFIAACRALFGLGGADALPLAAGPIAGQLTDRSDTIDTGGTAQQVAAANASRRYLLFQNHSDTDMWINFGTDAVASQPSIKIAAGVAYTPTFVDTRAISVICATMGKAFTCKEG